MVCNSGTSLVPTIDGEMHHFENVGLYDGLFVLQDVESKTLWNHITGEALYGPHVGRSLGPLGNMLQLSVERALSVDRSTQVAISGRQYSVGGQSFGAAGTGPAGPDMVARYAPNNPDARLLPAFTETLGAEDTRLERMTMGLGIVTADTGLFYPMALIEEQGALVDEIDGRQILVFVDPTTFTPAALYVDATTATLEERDIRLDTGDVVRRGILYDADGVLVDADRPQQLFSRWYGFALTFPGLEIYGR